MSATAALGLQACVANSCSTYTANGGSSNTAYTTDCVSRNVASGASCTLTCSAPGYSGTSARLCTAGSFASLVAPTCTANSCEKTQVPNSDKSTDDSIAGMSIFILNPFQFNSSNYYLHELFRVSFSFQNQYIFEFMFSISLCIL